MMGMAVGWSLLPFAFMVVACFAAAVLKPGPRVYSGMQHFAAGVVFASVAAELLPLMKGTVPMCTGFLTGVAAMLLVARSESSLMVALGIDLLLDGILLGIGFTAGAREGRILALALTLEVISLGLATGSKGAKLALLLVLGTAVGSGLASALVGPAQVFLISFGAAALLYLVTEELLAEAHETPDTPLLTAQFFLGFLLVLVLDGK